MVLEAGNREEKGEGGVGGREYVLFLFFCRVIRESVIAL